MKKFNYEDCEIQIWNGNEVFIFPPGSHNVKDVEKIFAELIEKKLIDKDSKLFY